MNPKANKKKTKTHGFGSRGAAKNYLRKNRQTGPGSSERY